MSDGYMSDVNAYSPAYRRRGPLYSATSPSVFSDSDRMEEGIVVRPPTPPRPRPAETHDDGDDEVRIVEASAVGDGTFVVTKLNAPPKIQGGFAACVETSDLCCNVSDVLL